MADIKNDEKCFTFTWKLENASYCLQKKGKAIQSPAFVVDEIHKTKWKLWLYPRGERNGNYISCFLHREFVSKREDTAEIKFELDFIGESGLTLTPESVIEHSFPNIVGEKAWGYAEFQEREDVFIVKRSTFLPKDTLRVRCRIWKNVGEMAENVRCFAHTRIGVEKRSFEWKLENFSAFEPEKERTYLIKSMEKDTELMRLNLRLTGGQNSEEMIHFQLTRRDQNIKYSAFSLSLVDINGRRVGCNQDEFWFDKLCNIQRFTFLFSRQMLKVKKSLYLPGDNLSLQWEWAFSKGVVSEKIGRSSVWMHCSRIKISDAHK